LQGSLGVATITAFSQAKGPRCLGCRPFYTGTLSVTRLPGVGLLDPALFKHEFVLLVWPQGQCPPVGFALVHFDRCRQVMQSVREKWKAVTGLPLRSRPKSVYTLSCP